MRKLFYEEKRALVILVIVTVLLTYLASGVV